MLPHEAVTLAIVRLSTVECTVWQDYGKRMMHNDPQVFHFSMQSNTPGEN